MKVTTLASEVLCGVTIDNLILVDRDPQRPGCCFVGKWLASFREQDSYLDMCEHPVTDDFHARITYLIEHKNLFKSR